MVQYPGMLTNYHSSPHLTEKDKTTIAKFMESKDMYEKIDNINLDDNKVVSAKKENMGILVTFANGTNYTIERPDILRLLSLKDGRRRRVRKTQRRKSTKRRHTRRYRRK